jgi:hypothetical protein
MAHRFRHCVKAIDDRLPEGGLALGALHEIAAAETAQSTAPPLHFSLPGSRLGPVAACCGA